MEIDIELKKLKSDDYLIWSENFYKINKDEFSNLISDFENINGNIYSFWVYSKKNSQPIGFVQLLNVLRKPAYSATIEISIFEKFKNQGYGKLAIKKLENEAFEKLGLMKLISPILPENLNSIKLFQSLNYQKMFIDPHAYFFNGKAMKCIIYHKISPRLIS